MSQATPGRTALLVAMIGAVDRSYARTARRPGVVAVAGWQLRHLEQNDGVLADTIRYTNGNSATALAIALGVDRVEVWDEGELVDLRDLS